MLSHERKVALLRLIINGRVFFTRARTCHTALAKSRLTAESYEALGRSENNKT